MAKQKHTNGINKNCTFAEFEDETQTWCLHHAKYVTACYWCDRAFHTTRIDALYCSNACRQAHHRKNQMVLPGF